MNHNTQLRDFIRAQDTTVDSMSSLLGAARAALWDIEEIEEEKAIRAIRASGTGLMPDTDEELNQKLRRRQDRLRSAMLSYTSQCEIHRAGLEAYVNDSTQLVKAA